MAVNYTNLFENIGEYVQRVNDFAGIISALGTDFSEIEAELHTNAMFDVLDGEFDQYEQYKAQVLAWIGITKGKILELFTHKATVLDELVYGSNTDFEAVIGALFEAMVDDSESIELNSVTLGAVTATMISAGDGTVITTKVLDGVTAPSSGYPVVYAYNGVDSELALSDDMALTCVSDSETDGATDGFETFQWAGRPASSDPYSWESFGSGDGPTVQPIQAGGILLNAEFQNFTTTNTPDDWTVNTGTVGTHILESATVHRGTKSLRLVGNASLAEINLSQLVTTLVPNKRYMVGFYVQGTTGTSAGTLTIQFEGTGYTAASTEKITMNAAALAAQTSFGWEYFWINTPATMPDDFELVIKWSGTPSAHSVYINGGGLRAADYFNGHAVMVIAGDEPFLRGDKFEYTVTNDYAGVFQTAFAKLFGIQLPSDASPTQADTLAT